MSNLVNLPVRRRATRLTPQQLTAGANRQVTLLLEAADQVLFDGLPEVAGTLVDRAREMVADLQRCVA